MDAHVFLEYWMWFIAHVCGVMVVSTCARKCGVLALDLARMDLWTDGYGCVRIYVCSVGDGYGFKMEKEWDERQAKLLTQCACKTLHVKVRKVSAHGQYKRESKGAYVWCGL